MVKFLLKIEREGCRCKTLLFSTKYKVNAKVTTHQNDLKQKYKTLKTIMKIKDYLFQEIPPSFDTILIFFTRACIPQLVINYLFIIQWSFTDCFGLNRFIISGWIFTKFPLLDHKIILITILSFINKKKNDIYIHCIKEPSTEHSNQTFFQKSSFREEEF